MKLSLLGFAAAAALLSTTAANAGVVDWTQWSNTFTTAGVNGGGSASGVSGAVTVTYSGELENLFLGYPSWGPSGTFDGGSVGNAPAAAGGIVQLYGGGSATNTITFSSAVTNPVFAIWSLGQGGVIPSFVFNLPFTIEAGGPSAEYAGSSIYSVGNTVYGQEGNGVIRFQGTVTSISWTNPTSENWYGFTVGTGGGAVPEPATWALMISGFGLAGAALRRRKAVVA